MDCRSPSFIQDLNEPMGVKQIIQQWKICQRHIAPAFLHRGIKFLGIGAFCTIVSYIVFINLVSKVDYFLANFVSWITSILINFILNRRFTYGIVHSKSISRQFILFIFGSLGQLFIATFSYWILIGHWRWRPTEAFVVTLFITALYMLIYLELIAFRKRGAS